MTLARYLKALARLWWIVVVAAVIGICLGLGSSMIMPKSYEAQTTIFVNVSESATVQDLQMGEQFAQSRAASYAAIGSSSEVIDPVSEQLGEDVSNAVTVTNAPNTATLSVSASDGDPEQAAAIAQGVSESLVEQAAILEGSADPAESPVQLNIVDEAQVPSGPAAPSSSMNVLVGAVVGVVIGLLIVLARAGSQTRRRDA
ncbi:Wzz/FepE/Etk N-terminal domain-containing protein [Kocuria sp. p3-SID1433]|uniref:YveK family protein n=1 Tax=unclassified Kocuria TaxID=2649579 RepID=UPI0021A75BC5|nr:MULTISPECIES: Wzz/FepE/Etk N-terminal domain-containing protein [unclassified Kocuria]MCT1602136.1 Wzz/FepE/Etk N-terminal domain-containing protein [Kocuria sp. p3-SID1428]MCT2179609.1 Wzz/FepE/Etk N-terminal domain-containing protein [Kocuria sp. p3-SID1433]